MESRGVRSAGKKLSHFDLRNLFLICVIREIRGCFSEFGSNPFQFLLASRGSLIIFGALSPPKICGVLFS